MNAIQRTFSWSCLFGLVVASSCGGGGGGGSGGSSSSRFTIVEASNGFGKLLPYQIAVRDALGQPTSNVIEIHRVEDLLANATETNPIKAPTEWPVGAVLPDRKPGNHFLYVEFSQDLEASSLLSNEVGEGGELTNQVQVLAIAPQTGATTPVAGRGFVGGKTFANAVDPLNANLLALETWVAADGLGGVTEVPVAGDLPGDGFPGTETGFAGAALLVQPNVFVFVVDSDDDLNTHEAFPTGLQIQMRLGSGIRSVRGRTLGTQAVASSTVGPDSVSPEVLVLPGGQQPVIVPGNGQTDVDPATNIVVTFTEPIQVLTVGQLDDGTAPALSAAIQVKFGPSQARVEVPFHVRPLSVFDLTRFELSPIYDFPGSGDLGNTGCGTFGTVDVIVNPAQFRDLRGNLNARSPTTSFTTRAGVGIVNAPVTPDTIYVGRGGSPSNQGISLIDLNGFGGGTGNPEYDPLMPVIEGNSNFPNNMNVRLQGSLLIPPLLPGSCTFDGGSSGVFTLTRDSGLSTLLTRSPVVESVGDMALGHALDNAFNNESPFGCQSGGGNICAATGLKSISLISGGPNTVASANIAPAIAPFKTEQGKENLASWAPHPNPPPLIFPPLCLSPLIGGAEPTSFLTTLPPLLLRNLLVPGPFPQGIPEIQQPPQGALSAELNTFFEGPSPPQQTIGACQPFMIRQQIGHFLYVADRSAGEIVILNSNRFSVIDRIRLPDPTSLAMSPGLDFLAVTNEGADQVSFIDINPASLSFHTVKKTTRVGSGPTGIAWEPGNEDILVCNQRDGTVSVISAFTLEVRKTLRNQITRPIDIAITPRCQFFGLSRNLYFAYILNSNGTVAFFESGPDGLNGFGFDDVVGSLPFTFFKPKTIQPDVTNLNSAVWIVHENPMDQDGIQIGTGGAVSNVGIAGGQLGVIPLVSFFGSPQLRSLEFGVFASVGEGPNGLSGVPVDIAFDNMRNLSAIVNFQTEFSAGTPISVNGKSLVKPFAGFLSASAPQFLFVAVPNPGSVDVFNMATGSLSRVDVNPYHDGIQSIPVPSPTVLMDYFRQ